MRFTNHYHCPECDTSWHDDWHCACNDDCPDCGAEIEPEDSTDHLPEKVREWLGEPTPAIVASIRARFQHWTNLLIDWLVQEGWSREELGPDQQRKDIMDELRRQLENAEVSSNG